MWDSDNSTISCKVTPSDIMEKYQAKDTVVLTSSTRLYNMTQPIEFIIKVGKQRGELKIIEQGPRTPEDFRYYMNSN